MEEHNTDIHFSGILKAGVALLVVAVVVHILMWLLFGFFKAQEAREDPKPPPMFQKDQKPPEPRLQQSPPQDLQSFRETEKDNLEKYGWVNPEKGIVRIPVKEAIKIVVEREKAFVSQPADESAEQ